MKILAVNAGSSSLKFQLYEMPEEKVIISGLFQRIGITNPNYFIKFNGQKIEKEADLQTHKDAVRILLEELLAYKAINSLDEIKGIGHRLVHGGDKYSSSVVINDEVLDTIKSLIPLAPLHNPANIIGVEAFQSAIKDALQVGCFDTAFHQTMDETSYLYGVPYDWYQNYKVRKYGFHGMSHKYISDRMAKIMGNKNINVISCHIGNGCSVAAIKDGKCIDTSMGFTPNSGLIMGTRSGDIDATFIPYVMKEAGMTLEEVMDALNKESGYLGISGVGSDGRDIEAGIEAGNQRCILARKLYVKRVVDYIAKYFVELESLDALVFTAGVGENSVSFRSQVIAGLKALGFKLNDEINKNTHGTETLISSDDSSVKIYVIPTDEEVMIARDTYNFIK